MNIEKLRYIIVSSRNLSFKYDSFFFYIPMKNRYFRSEVISHKSLLHFDSQKFKNNTRTLQTPCSRVKEIFYWLCDVTNVVINCLKKLVFQGPIRFTWWAIRTHYRTILFISRSLTSPCRHAHDILCLLYRNQSWVAVFTRNTRAFLHSTEYVITTTALSVTVLSTFALSYDFFQHANIERQVYAA